MALVVNTKADAFLTPPSSMSTVGERVSSREGVRAYGMPLRKRYRDALVAVVRDAEVALTKGLLLEACDDAASENGEGCDDNGGGDHGDVKAEARVAIEELVLELAAFQTKTDAAASLEVTANATPSTVITIVVNL